MNSPAPLSLTREWLEADGLGGFASGTASGIRTRRYHSLLLVATRPPTGRLVLVNGLDAWVETPGGKFSLSSQCYSPGIIGGDRAQHIEAFGWEPWPHWIFKLEDGTRIEQEILVAKGAPMTCISWKILGPQRAANLFVRPFVSGRDYHSLHKANPAFRFDAEVKPTQVSWAPYTGVPGIAAFTNGKYSHQPVWYYNFRYEEEQARGLDCEEDLAAPGVFKWDLARGRAALIFSTKDHAATKWSGGQLPLELLNQVRESEQKRRESFPSRLEASADSYIVQHSRSTPPVSGGQSTPNGRGKTIIAGYPWFTDWGRDTFIALRGLCLATGRLDDARDILLAWSNTATEGMLPNRFPDQGEQPEFNSVDASLWFVVAAFEYLQTARKRQQVRQDEVALGRAIEGIINGYAQGTRYGIRMDDDGLLSCGQPGTQLTWMDAKVGDWVVTPRIGKPVEIQALWLNALWIANHFTSRWEHRLTQGMRTFEERFWNDNLGFLNDVVDVDHQAGTIDPSLRPNQILAIGGLPIALIEGEAARLVVETVERLLLTPLGLRSLAQQEQGYVPQYCGGVAQRDGAYHLGTVWPWLLGPFVEAWVRVRGGTNEVKRIARKRFLRPLLQHMEEAGLGHISEISDAEAPHAPRGCPFQAWSVGEALRLDRIILTETVIQRPAKVRAKQRRDLMPA
ncbi:MAG TPA: amylo-alpha-1,6-glucosidase [Candidatus Limnocylindrales bacterium]|nr:amylo-alpha-1,6-glucosidase [Candidatus Limnocylindrales bacterium]